MASIRIWDSKLKSTSRDKTCRIKFQLITFLPLILVLQVQDKCKEPLPRQFYLLTLRTKILNPLNKEFPVKRQTVLKFIADKITSTLIQQLITDTRLILKKRYQMRGKQ